MKTIYQPIMIAFLLFQISLACGQSFAIKAGGIAKFSDFRIGGYQANDNSMSGLILNIEYQSSRKWTINFGLERTYSSTMEGLSSTFNQGSLTVFSFLPEFRFYFSEALDGIFLGGRLGVNAVEESYRDTYRGYYSNDLALMGGASLGTQLIISDKVSLELRIGISGSSYWHVQAPILDLGISAGGLFQRASKKEDIWD